MNNDDLLDVRLKELHNFFEQSSYPSDMTSKEVISEVRLKPISLDYRNGEQKPTVFTPWIMTYGAGHEETKEKAREMKDLVCNSRTWMNTSPSKIPKFQVVTRRVPAPV